MKSVQTIFLAACLAALSYAGTAAADTMSVTVNNYYGETVQVEFYSQWYDDAWPGGGQAYVVDYSETMLLNCEPGEQIAFGAWVQYDPAIYWGVGDGHQACTDCVLTCGYNYTRDLGANPDLYGD